jgi:hypothetical protein
MTYMFTRWAASARASSEFIEKLLEQLDIATGLQARAASGALTLNVDAGVAWFCPVRSGATLRLGLCDVVIESQVGGAAGVPMLDADVSVAWFCPVWSGVKLRLDSCDIATEFEARTASEAPTLDADAGVAWFNRAWSRAMLGLGLGARDVAAGLHAGGAPTVDVNAKVGA